MPHRLQHHVADTDADVTASSPLAAIDVAALRGRRATSRWNRVSVGDLLERLTWSEPEKEAIVGWEGAYENLAHARLTYLAADRLANQVAHALLAEGLRAGDVVALLTENSVEALVTKLGIAKAGLVAAPMNPSMAADQLASMIELVEPAFLVVDAELWPRAELVLTERGVLPGVAIAIGGPLPGVPTFTEFVAGRPTAEPDAVVHGDDIAEILFTSGTTASPKGVMLSHSNAYMGGYSFTGLATAGLRFQHHLRLGCFLPIVYHSGDVLFTAVALSGGTLVLGRRPDPTAMAQAVHTERLTALWAGMPRLVRAVVAALDERPELDTASLHTLVYGWSPMPADVYAALKERVGEQVTVAEILGMTEVIPAHRYWHEDNHAIEETKGTEDNYVGLPSPAIAARLDDAGATVPLGGDGVGEVVYRSPALMAGYYRDEEATRHALRDGWFHGGDAFRYGQEDQRLMVDRYKDLIKSGGENVASARVEAVLREHPAVDDVAVVGLPHPEWDEAVTAVVVARDGAGGPGLEADLVDRCKQRLARYEAPKRVVFVDALPVTVGGKILKHRLREQLAGLYTREEETARV
ncbi:class I adenylate-forming enzyme family protein [Georgenia daeguensis]|uniref:Long-chain fatty acid--CoA ligase n=1 Tax=Georgenia daeguensis TaxID=908355 RepID=A0ABP8EUI5_9MICO